ncbi:hypothetical protein SEA_LATRETIUM_42 [Mycobacterium phage Latretium]|nr:hypothetical protein SEA_LATRETIUM_42 [Mycobacterium phage Latretium]
MARARGVVPEPNRSRLVKAARASARSDEKLRHEVIEASAAGGSVREIAVLTGKSTNTIQRWLKEG